MAKPKLALIPAAQGSKLFSVLPSSGVGDFDFSRSGKATRINSQGLIEEVSNGQSRLNYPMIDGKVVGCPHHILEPARSNSLTYSEDFSNASWIKDSTSIVSNAIISPDGSLNGSLITANGANIDHTIYQEQSLTPQTYIFSTFVKKNTQRYVHLAINRLNASTLWVSSVFDLDTLDTADYSNGSGYNDGVSKIENYGNDWYKISLTAYLPDSTVYLAFIGFAEDMTAPNISRGRWQFATSDSFYIWGAMLEQGSYPTSYIKTNGSAVTRSAETATGSGDAATFNGLQGVLMAEIQKSLTSSLFDLGLYGSSASNQVRIGWQSNNVYATVYDGAIQAQMVYSNTLSDFNKISFKYKENDFALWVNGFEVATDNSGSTFSSGDLIKINFSAQDGVAYPFHGKAKQIQYYDSALTDSELEQLTSWTSFTDMAEGQLYTIE